VEEGLLTMASSSYTALLQEAQPEIIHGDKTHKRALAWIDRLMRKKRLSAAEEKLLELLSKLVNDYEETIYPTPNASPRDALQHLLENCGLSHAALARQVGIPRSTISEVLRGTRSISVEIAFRLGEYFHVEPSLFLTRASTAD
jgi:HTH-type transcriptional regulator/antitoxin HigA